MYKRQIYQTAESNRIEKNRFGSENRIESNRNFFRPNWNALLRTSEPISLALWPSGALPDPCTGTAVHHGLIQNSMATTTTTKTVMKPMKGGQT